DKIVVFGQKSYDYYFMPDYYYNSKTFVKIYDISEKDNPKLIKDILITGNYFQSRMIDDYVYVIISEPVYYNPPRPVPLPVITTDKTTKTISANEIYYFGYPDYSYSYTTVMSINLQSLSYETKTFLIGVSQNLYVSRENIYLAYTKYIDQYEINQRFFENVVIPNLPQSVIQKINEIKAGNFEQHQEFYQIMNVIDEYISNLDEDQRSEFMKRIEKESSEFFAELSKESEKTIINKLSINGHNIDFVANSEVPGHVLNQFSMDEYNGNFRIATTVSGFNSESFNNIYVLDKNMNIIGKIEGLAEGERIYSVRFLNEKVYVVTFKQIDPFFVIDLSDPRKPNVLGYLKLPGVSDYLHPYDENYIIGFGRDIDEDGRVKGLKVSMFDVSDFNNPKEVSKYVVQGNVVYSEALYEHKAFLFSKEKNLMVVPASISRGGFYTWETWNGLLVFNVNSEKIDLKGRIEQDQGFSQIRSLYIDDVLYSVSTSYITANRIDDLSEINKIKLSDIIYVSR
ncbi:MAG: beta-propeller domain-containing protein, partial [Candidatus Aenigmatarchaeota archaeon]